MIVVYACQVHVSDCFKPSRVAINRIKLLHGKYSVETN